MRCILYKLTFDRIYSIILPLMTIKGLIYNTRWHNYPAGSCLCESLTNKASVCLHHCIAACKWSRDWQSPCLLILLNAIWCVLLSAYKMLSLQRWINLASEISSISLFHQNQHVHHSFCCRFSQIPSLEHHHWQNYLIWLCCLVFNCPILMTV